MQQAPDHLLRQQHLGQPPRHPVHLRDRFPHAVRQPDPPPRVRRVVLRIKQKVHTLHQHRK